MEAYIGTKIVRAEPEERVDITGTLQPGYAVVYVDGYRSWSPKDAFEHSYRKITIGEKYLVFPTPED